VISNPTGRAAYEPLYDIDPRTGASVEVFYADRVLAQSFGASCPGWSPKDIPTGLFGSSYLPYSDFAIRKRN